MEPRKPKYQFTKEELQNLLYDYNRETGAIPQDHPLEAHIWDETLRDGEQTPGVHLSLEEKITIATFLDEIGTAKMAVGFPAVSESEQEIVKAITHIGLSKTTVMGISRPRESDIDACLKADLEEIVLFMPTSDLMMKILHETPESEIEKITRSFDYAKSHGLKFNWVSEDGTRARPEHLLKIFQLAIDHEAECIVLGDTVGVLQPETTIYLMERFKRELDWHTDNNEYYNANRHTALGIHNHNDFGQATANTVAAVFHGAIFPHVCVNGYGERAGNAAFEEVVMNLEQMGIKTGIQLNRLTELSQKVEQIFAFPLSAHKPIVGANAFSHESGLHINAIVSHPISYEPINPAIVGQKRRFYLGKFSGSAAILDAMQSKLKINEITIPDEIIKKIVQDVKAKHEQTSKQETQELYKQTKLLIEKVQSGITDTEFFEIVYRDAGEYLKGTWAESPGKESKESSKKSKKQK